MRFCKLRQKEVVNVTDGKSLGYIVDVEIDILCGQITAIVVPGPIKFKPSFRDKNCVIPWCNICKIGKDVILVELDTTSCSCN